MPPTLMALGRYFKCTTVNKLRGLVAARFKMRDTLSATISHAGLNGSGGIPSKINVGYILSPPLSSW